MLQAQLSLKLSHSRIGITKTQQTEEQCRKESPTVAASITCNTDTVPGRQPLSPFATNQRHSSRAPATSNPTQEANLQKKVTKRELLLQPKRQCKHTLHRRPDTHTPHTQISSKFLPKRQLALLHFATKNGHKNVPKAPWKQTEIAHRSRKSSAQTKLAHRNRDEIRRK